MRGEKRGRSKERRGMLVTNAGNGTRLQTLSPEWHDMRRSFERQRPF